MSVFWIVIVLAFFAGLIYHQARTWLGRSTAFIVAALVLYLSFTTPPGSTHFMDATKVVYIWATDIVRWYGFALPLAAWIALTITLLFDAVVAFLGACLGQILDNEGRRGGPPSDSYGNAM